MPPGKGVSSPWADRPGKDPGILLGLLALNHRIERVTWDTSLSMPATSAVRSRQRRTGTSNTFNEKTMQAIRSCIPLAVALPLVIPCLPNGSAHADERLRMIGPSQAEEAVTTLTNALETACVNRDVVGFLSQFTPRRAAQIRRPMEDLFVCHDVTLDVQDTVILSQSESAIVFGVRYSVHHDATPMQTIASRVTAKRVGTIWRLDGEEIVGRKSAIGNSAVGAAPVAKEPGGRIPFMGRPDWVPRDIEWVPGGCAGGRCGL